MSIGDKLIQFRDQVNQKIDTAFSNKWFCLITGVAILALAGFAFYKGTTVQDSSLIALAGYSGTGALAMGALLCYKAYLRHKGSDGLLPEYIRRIDSMSQKAKLGLSVLYTIIALGFLLLTTRLHFNQNTTETLIVEELGAASMVFTLAASIYLSRFMMQQRTQNERQATERQYSIN